MTLKYTVEAKKIGQPNAPIGYWGDYDNLQEATFQADTLRNQRCEDCICAFLQGRSGPVWEAVTIWEHDVPERLAGVYLVNATRLGIPRRVVTT